MARRVEWWKVVCWCVNLRSWIPGSTIVNPTILGNTVAERHAYELFLHLTMQAKLCSRQGSLLLYLCASANGRPASAGRSAKATFQWRQWSPPRRSPPRFCRSEALAGATLAAQLASREPMYSKAKPLSYHWCFVFKLCKCGMLKALVKYRQCQYRRVRHIWVALRLSILEIISSFRRKFTPVRSVGTTEREARYLR